MKYDEPIETSPATERGAAGEGTHFDELVRTAHRVPFSTLIDHLERLIGPEAVPVGELGPPRAERIRFRHDIQPVFHAGDVTQLRIVEEHDEFTGRKSPPIFEVSTSFLGVVGSVSPLASFFTEDALRAAQQDDDAVLALYDAFHHRLISLFLRASRRVGLSPSLSAGGRDASTRRALSLVGGASFTADVPALAPLMRLGRARLFAQRPRGRDALVQALSLAFPDLAITVLEAPWRDIELAPSEMTRLGERRNLLGEVVLGGVLTKQAGLLVLWIAPVGRATLARLVPSGADHARFRYVIEEVTGGFVDVAVEIEVRPGEEPRLELGNDEAALGGTAALGQRSPDDPPMIVRIELSAGAEAVTWSFRASPPSPARA
ncbi:type VI secretion system baseplate subunit TssG [Pendulispora brunnea]|uniref:Type VI secretion system baseplate subunit TssG n=1 Tax=Pendulispora brunnea TaxID=2905690 RepID=A0ABZ2K053_9BACT